MTMTDTENPDASPVDALSDLCADLLAEARYETVVTRVFDGPAGGWQRLTALLRGFDDVVASVEALDQLLSSPTHMTWLPAPANAEDTGYCAVMFFNHGGLGRIWTYNRGRLAARATPI